MDNNEDIIVEFLYFWYIIALFWLILYIDSILLAKIAELAARHYIFF